MSPPGTKPPMMPTGQITQGDPANNAATRSDSGTR